MPRWPAFARRARLPGPIFWDVVLALAIAALSLVTIEAERRVIEPVPAEIKLSSTPFGLDAGEPWEVEIVVTNPPATGGRRTAADLAESAGWLALVVALSFVLALGFSSLVGSRGTSIGVLLGWWLVATPVLTNLGTLGSTREGLAGAALERLAPATLFEGDPAVPMSPAAAVVVVAAWAIVPLAVGAWRTCTRDA